MNCIVVEREIRAPLGKVQKYIWDIQSWAGFWAPLHEVIVQYDDGMHQDFKMALDWRKQDAVVRTVRFRKLDGEIHFFSPQPPPPTVVHQGLWRFVSQGENATKLTAVRWFQLPDFMDVEDFSSGFMQRLTELLEKLGNQCEK